MRRQLALLGLLSLTSLTLSLASAEIAGADAAEVIAKVRAAARLIGRDGIKAIGEIGDPQSEFKWKDSYVFVVNCDADRVMANSAFPNRVGGDIKQHTDYAGTQYGLQLCKTARQSRGGWLEYVWLRPESDIPRRKVSYVVTVPGTPYQVGAGIYDETVTLDELHSMTDTR